MIIKKLKECEEFISGDNAHLRELLHAEKGDYTFRYSLAHAVVKPKHKTRKHVISVSEVYYIIQGKGRMHIDSEVQDVEEGCAVYIPPHAAQYIENIGTQTLEFLCIVDPAWRKEQENIIT